MCHASVRISHAECHVASKIPRSEGRRENCFSFLGLQDCTGTQSHVINSERFFSPLLSRSWTLPRTEGYIEILQMFITGVNCDVYSAAGLKFSVCHEVHLPLSAWRIARPGQRCFVLHDASCSVWDIVLVRFERGASVALSQDHHSLGVLITDQKVCIVRWEHKADRWFLLHILTTGARQRCQAHAGKEPCELV